MGVGPRSTIFTVAERAHAPINGLRYELHLYCEANICRLVNDWRDWNE